MMVCDFSPLRTRQSLVLACLSVIQRGSSKPRRESITLLMPLYTVPDTGFRGGWSSPGRQGFCQGATPFLRSAMICSANSSWTGLREILSPAMASSPHH